MTNMQAVASDVAAIPRARWLRIIPAVIIVYIVAYMDRTNIAIAMAGGMSAELGMTASFAGLAAGIFFVGYIFLQIPGGQIAERLSAKKFIAGTIVVWGGVAALTGLVRTQNEMLLIRFVLGVAEGGVYPAILALIGHWFPNEEKARAIAFFQMNLAVASIITAPLSGWLIQSMGWREMFVVEGVLLDKRFAEDKAKAVVVENVSVSTVVGDANLWKLVAIYFFFQVGFYGFALWMPVIIKQLTGSGMTTVGFLTALPYILCIGGQFLIANRCDQTMNRRLYTVIPMIGFAICLTLSIMLEGNIWLSYAMIVLCGFFLQAYAGPFWTLPPLLFPSNVVGGVRGTINALGNLGGFIGPFLVGYLTTAFSKDVGLSFLIAALVIASALLFTLPKVTSKAPR